MASFETAFEYLLAAHEAVRGTKIDPPTIYLNMAGKITPKQSVYRPVESRGVLADWHRSKVVRQWSEIDAAGPADVYSLPFLLEQLVKAPGVIATPGGGTNSRTHTYAPTMNADNLLSGTYYWGDPNIQAFQSDYMMLDSLVIAADGSGTDGVTQAIKGMGHFPAKDAPDSVPAMRNAPLLAPSDLQLWIDTSSAIGSTEIIGRIVSAEVTIPSGVTRKWIVSGPTGGQNFGLCGRKRRHAEMKLVFELPDMTQYDLWAAHTSLKVRLRYNGPIIESTLRHYIQVDLYAPFDPMDWGELEGSNRTIALNLLSEYDTNAAAAGYDFCVVVQNDLATL